MTTLLESITYIHEPAEHRSAVAPFEPFHVRVWREEPNQGFAELCNSRGEVHAGIFLKAHLYCKVQGAWAFPRYFSRSFENQWGAGSIIR